MNLKRFTILSILSLLIKLQAHAQDEVGDVASNTGLRYGFKVGFVISEFSNTQPHTTEKLGFTAGAVVEYGFSEQLSVQAEPSYLQQGGNLLKFIDDSRFGDDDSFGTSSTTNYAITIHSIDVPVLVKYRLPAFGNFVPNVVLGPSVSYTVMVDTHFERTYHHNQTFMTVSGYDDVTSEYKPIQIGATAGIGGEVSLGNKRLMMDLRYRYGITEAKSSYSYIDLRAVQGDLTTHNVYFTLGIGL